MSKSLYAAYFTSTAGTSIGLFYIGDGIIAGADAGGITYDGTLEPQPDGSYKGIVKYIVPPERNLITGISGPSASDVSLAVAFPQDFGNGKSVFSMATPLGTISARFVHWRELP